MEVKCCLDCFNFICMNGCFVGINILKFIKNIECGEFFEVVKILKVISVLFVVCGCVCF